MGSAGVRTDGGGVGLGWGGALREVRAESSDVRAPSESSGAVQVCPTPGRPVGLPPGCPTPGRPGRAAEAGRAKTRDPAEAYAQLSRAVRLTLTLEAKTVAELSDLKAGIVREREEKRARAAEATYGGQAYHRDRYARINGY